jgi:hypothetical protein
MKYLICLMFTFFPLHDEPVLRNLIKFFLCIEISNGGRKNALSSLIIAIEWFTITAP